MTIRRAPSLLAGCAALLLLAACSLDTRGGTGSSSAAPTTSAPSSSSAPTTRVSTTPAPPADAAQRALAAMTLPQRVGQLFMVGATSTALDPAALAAIRDNAVGSVILDGNSTLSAAQTAAIVAGLQQLTGPVKLFVATDQEGGQVQRLRGAGFSTIPSGLVQGTIAPATLRADAKTWGTELAAAGINLDLAPVMDTVPSASFAPNNPPIGAFDREYGYTPDVVTAHGVAFLQGLLDAGVDSTAKHFPGLGRVTGNTDTTAGVTDNTTTRTDPYLAPFAAAVNAGSPFVMMSTAVYSKIDPANPAAFSSTIVTGMLRGDLHFGGVVISDDLGAAVQVASFAPGDRATDFIAAGGDIVLTVSADEIAPMVAAVLARAQSDPAFAAQVNAAALRVLEAKQARGLLS